MLFDALLRVGDVKPCPQDAVFPNRMVRAERIRCLHCAVCEILSIALKYEATPLAQLESQTLGS